MSETEISEAAIDRSHREEDAAEKVRRRAETRAKLLADQKAAQVARERRQTIDQHNALAAAGTADLERHMQEWLGRCEALSETARAVFADLATLTALDRHSRSAPLRGALPGRMMEHLIAALPGLPLPLRRPEFGPYRGNAWPRDERADWMAALQILED